MDLVKALKSITNSFTSRSTVKKKLNLRSYIFGRLECYRVYRTIPYMQQFCKSKFKRSRI